MTKSVQSIFYPPKLQVARGFADLETAILRTVAYADVFDFALKPAEILRYLIGVESTWEEVEGVLGSWSEIMSRLRYTDGYFTLAGREGLVRIREQRERASVRRWLAARRYGKWIAALPHVRMVAVTGALAVDNETGRDLDYLVVTQSGRLWTCRGLVILLVRWARRYGDEICPNYFLDETALALSDQNLYTAHEMAQMVPVSGFDVYQQMRNLNPWVEAYLPNASGMPWRAIYTPGEGDRVWSLQRVAEAGLRTAPGNWVEKWEQQRKIPKFRARDPLNFEADFCAERCKGHFGGYERNTHLAYQARLQKLGLSDGFWRLG